MNNRTWLPFIACVVLALSLSSCTKRKPEEIDYAPGTPFNPYPPDSATNVEHTTLDVTLRWTATDPNSGDVLTYALYFDTLNPPQSNITSGLASPSYFMNGLSYNTTYYWRLYITDDKGVTTSGPVWRFTTLPHANSAPNVPAYYCPANNSPGLYPTMVLGWGGTDPQGDSDTLFYDLYFGVTPQPPLTLFTNYLDSSLEFTGLDYATTYYWKMAVRDNHYAYTSGPVYSFTTRDCPWFYKRELPSPRYGFGTAVVNSKIYVVGGTDGLNFLSEVLEYDPLLDTWVRKADMPTPRCKLAVAVWNNLIYAIGGQRTGAVDNNEVFDPQLNVWSTLTSLPVTNDNFTSAHAIKGKIYTNGPVFEYNIATDDWWDSMIIIADTIAPDTIYVDTFYNYIKSYPPNGSHGRCSAVYNNLIYVMGGSDGPYPMPNVDVYHPGTNLWTTASDMIGPANYSAATVANGFIYVIGGYDHTYSKRVRKYDPASDTWFIRSDLQKERCYLCSAFVGGNIYAIGGISTFPLATVEEYRLTLDPKR
jgi:N-acetylneuraminic acid mutarotase